MATRTIALLAALCATAGCSTHSPTPFEPSTDIAPQVTATVGEPFLLSIGEVAAVAGSDVRILFSAVPADSRCPVDVTCVWEGDAEVRLGLARVGEEWVRRSIHTAVDPEVTEFGNFRFSVLELRPAPDTRAPTEPADYQVRLGVERI